MQSSAVQHGKDDTLAGAPDAKRACTGVASKASAADKLVDAKYLSLFEYGEFDEASDMFDSVECAHMVLSHLPPSTSMPDLRATATFLSGRASGIQKVEAFVDFANKNKERPLNDLMAVFDELKMDTQSLVSPRGLSHLVDLGTESIVTACIFHRHAIFRQALPSDFAREVFVRIFDMLDFLATHK